MKIGKERELKFTLKALQEINKKYGSLEGMQKVLQNKENPLAVIDDLIWLICLFANQSILSRNLDIDEGIIQGAKENIITEEYVAIKMEPAEIINAKSNIFDSITKGSNVQVDIDEESMDEDLMEIEKNVQTAADQ